MQRYCNFSVLISGWFFDRLLVPFMWLLCDERNSNQPLPFQYIYIIPSLIYLRLPITPWLTSSFSRLLSRSLSLMLNDRHLSSKSISPSTTHPKTLSTIIYQYHCYRSLTVFVKQFLSPFLSRSLSFALFLPPSVPFLNVVSDTSLQSPKQRWQEARYKKRCVYSFEKTVDKISTLHPLPPSTFATVGYHCNNNQSVHHHWPYIYLLLLLISIGDTSASCRQSQRSAFLLHLMLLAAVELVDVE